MCSFSDEKARENIDKCINKRQWPVVLTPLDTAGEKPYEEFFSKDEQVIDINLSALAAVVYKTSEHGDVSKVKDILKKILDNTPLHNSGFESLNKNVFRDLIATIQPEFLKTHRNVKGNLDQRM